MSSYSHLLRTLSLVILVGASGLCQAVPVSVPGTSDPWLAGMPAGSTASSGDVAPAHSPVEVTLNLGLDGFLTFTGASGGVNNDPGCPPSCFPIDGSGFFNHFDGAQNGISDVRAPLNALLGLFLNGTQPNLTAALGSLDFENIGLDFLTLSPLLKQVFFIGDGLTSSSAVQQFNIPSGATRLFLGTMDGFGWFNNSGAINVDVTQIAPSPATVSEPATLALLGIGLAAIICTRRRRL